MNYDNQTMLKSKLLAILSLVFLLSACSTVPKEPQKPIEIEPQKEVLVKKTISDINRCYYQRIYGQLKNKGLSVFTRPVNPKNFNTKTYVIYTPLEEALDEMQGFSIKNFIALIVIKHNLNKQTPWMYLTLKQNRVGPYSRLTLDFEICTQDKSLCFEHPALRASFREAENEAIAKFEKSLNENNCNPK